ncbi:glycosyltransferase family A protein [Nonlabens sp. MIC269]|uniref:glycosyltransferase family 2 protein n=1 Tax=Nonlabens sp. MIC269 TaxID=1476901 RepID=UPI000762237D|nr:glycosyltransferase family A protein [Nonlabens sp. MIC269]
MSLNKEVNNGLVSIILPVFNGEEYLAQAIESCLTQTYTNFELIIVDDCSTDSSLEIAENYQKLDGRINIFQNEENSKLPSSLNYGIEQARGNFITWTSDDNILKPFFLETLVCYLELHQVDFVYSDYDIIYHDGTFFKYQPVGALPELLFQNIIGCSFLAKASLFKNNKYDSDLFRIEDYAFWLMNLPKVKCKPLYRSLYFYRVHGSSLTAQISNTGGFQKEIVELMYSRVQEQYRFSEVTENFLIDNCLDKNNAALSLLDNSSHLFRDIKRSSKYISSNDHENDFNHIVKHYEKLMDKLSFKKSIVLASELINSYNYQIISLRWFIIYALKRIKRLVKIIFSKSRI